MLTRRGFEALVLLGILWGDSALAQPEAPKPVVPPQKECVAAGGDQRVSILRGSKRDMEAVPGDDCSERSPE